MPFPGNVGRFVWSGSLAGGETFAFGYYALAVTGQSAQVTATSELAKPLVQTFLTTARQFLATEDTYETLTYYLYGPGRSAIDVGVAQISNGVGTGTAPHPKYVACCLTLRTDTASRRGRGRIYVPATGKGVVSNGWFQNSDVQSLVTATANLMGASLGKVVSEADGVARDVVRVDADVIPDTQHGRTRRYRSTRVSTAVPQ